MWNALNPSTTREAKPAKVDSSAAGRSWAMVKPCPMLFALLPDRSMVTKHIKGKIATRAWSILQKSGNS